MALVFAVGSALLVPLCTMPACDDTGAAACADFQPVCDDCPPNVVMKHDHGDAVSVHAPAPVNLVATPVVTATEPVVPVVFALAGPIPTASPPPLDPLGVRLLV
jgi:hypothetical protein